MLHTLLNRWADRVCDHIAARWMGKTHEWQDIAEQRLRELEATRHELDQLNSAYAEVIGCMFEWRTRALEAEGIIAKHALVERE